MMALTIWQPHASLVASGAKRFETRDRRYPRGRIGDQLAIHAAKAPGFAMGQFQPATLEAITDVVGHDWQSLPRSRVLCVARVVGQFMSLGEYGRGADGGLTLKVAEDLQLKRHNLIETRKRWISIAESERHFGDLRMGRWLWELKVERVFASPPVAKGHQFIWDWKEAFHHA